MMFASKTLRFWLAVGCGIGALAIGSRLPAQGFQSTQSPSDTQYNFGSKSARATTTFATEDPAPAMMPAAELIDYDAPPASRGYLFSQLGPPNNSQAADSDSRSARYRRPRRTNIVRVSATEPVRSDTTTSEVYVERLPPDVVGTESVVAPQIGNVYTDANGPYDNDFSNDPLGTGDNYQPRTGWWGYWDQMHEWSHRSPLFSPKIWRNFYEFGGVQGFKGPVDLGVNGNFGFYKGVNSAWPVLNSLGIGYQLGGEIVLSDLSGGSGLVNSHRDQYFVTTGLFRRAICNYGFQCGAVVDYLHDSFYLSMDLVQVRAETSFVMCEGHEVGVWAALHVQSDTKTAPAFLFPQTSVTWQPNNQYNLFYRRNFGNGALGRTWIGLTDFGDVLFGSDATAPLSEQWAVQASYNYLLPKHDGSIPDSIKETWGLSLCLVWYPHCKVPNACFNPYKPLFNVADNSTFFTRTR